MIAKRFILRLSLAALSFAAASIASTAQTATVTPNWTQQSPATSPSARSGSTMVYDAATGQVVLFGGSSSSTLGDTWTYNGTTWTQQSPATSPSAREYSAMAYDAATGQLVLFGGTSGSSNLGDTWTYNGTTWTQQSPSSSPPARYGSTMAYDAATGQVVLFGGYGSSYLSDTWTYNGTTWTQQSPATSPPAREYAAMAYDAATGQVVLFAGFGNSTLDDTWTYNGTTWTQQSPTNSPPGRGISTMAYDTATGQLVLFGGFGIYGYLADTWTYNGTTWTQQSTAASPSIRYFSAMAYDAATGQVVLFGGYNTSNLGDTWTYQLGAAGIPNSAVGTAAAQTPVYFLIGTAGTLPALSNTNVLMQGASGLDFTLGTGSTCTGAVTAGQTCKVNVAFTPKMPGQRMGAVELFDSSTPANLLATAYISGTGTGPLATLSPGLLTTVAGTGTACSPATAACGDGASATATGANFKYPSGVAVDGAGNLYIADYSDQRIRKVTAATGILSTVAGTGTVCSSSTSTCGDGAAATATGANLRFPDGVAVDGAGNLYIADEGDNRIRKVTAATGILSTVAGTGTACSSSTATCGDGAAATATGANLNYPAGVAVDGAGNLYIADSNDSRIRKVTAATGILSTVAGTGTVCFSSTLTCGDGASATATGANLDFPEGVAVDGAGNLYIADYNDHRIRKVTAATGILSTVAGTGTQCATSTATCGDGASATATGANLNYPYGVAVDAAGNLYIADTNDSRIRKVAAATGIITTVAGTGTQCSAATATCGNGTSATATGSNLNYPDGVAVDAAGNLYIADTNDNRIRKVSTAAGIVFPTTTSAGTADTTDGTQTVTLNNLGNASLVLTSQTETSSNFVLGNPMSGGCSTATPVAAGGSCLIGATFTPQTGQSGLLVGSVATTDNSLNVAGTVQFTPLMGITSAGAIAIAVNEVVTTAGTASVLMGFQYDYTGTPDTGAQTITVNGSATGVGAVSCVYKNSHANCSFTYTGPALATVNGNGYAITVAIAAASPYAAGSGTNYLYVNPAVTQGGGRIGQPVNGFAATPVVAPVAKTPVAPVAVLPPTLLMGNTETTTEACSTKEDASGDCKK